MGELSMSSWQVRARIARTDERGVAVLPREAGETLFVQAGIEGRPIAETNEALAVKEMDNAAEEMSLAQGIRFERRLFHGLFGTEDQKEGMAAFVDKRVADWKGK